MAKQKIKKRPSSTQTWAAPTKERCRQDGGVISELISKNGSVVKRYRAAWASPLEAYHANKLIDEGRYRAGLQFHEAYYGAVLCRKLDTRPTSREEAAIGPSKHEKLLKEAFAMLPSETVNTVVDVCGHSQRIYSPQALEKLRKGLGRLAIQWHSSAIEICEPKEE